MNRCFLFQRDVSGDLSGGKRHVFWIWNIGMLVIAGILLGMATMLLSFGGYSQDIMAGYFEIPGIAVLNIVPCILLVLLLYAITGRGWIAFLVSSLLMLGLATANYFMLLFRDDPLMFEDILLIREAGRIAGRYNLAFDWRLTTCLFFVITMTVLLFFFVRGRSRKSRMVTGIISLLLAIASWPVYTSHACYDAAINKKYVDYWSETQRYIGHGFTYAFIRSIPEAFDTKPEGYTEEKAEAILEAYEDADIPEDRKVNVICTMLEAHNDLSKFAIEGLNPDIYDSYHRLEEESYTGNLITNIFAAGTIQTERKFLTGYSYLRDIRAETNSYVWYFRDQGYTTEGSHPYNEWFYNRLNVNRHLGFENYYYLENHYEDISGIDFAYDGDLFPEIINLYEANKETGKPYFGFNVSFQGHGPYPTNQTVWGDEFISRDAYSEKTYNILSNYLGSVANTNYHISTMVDHFRAEEEPTVLVFFGDHNPWLGDGNSVYKELGINLDISTAEGFYNYYGTRYLIWANDAAKNLLGNEFVGEGPNIGPYFLMSELFALCGWNGPSFMQVANETKAVVPVFDTAGYYVENDELTESLHSAGEVRIQQFRYAQYYWRRNFQYHDVSFNNGE